MKHATNLLCIYAAVFAIIYLLGSFGQASFNLSNWDSEARGMVAVFAGMIMAMASLLYAMSNDLKR